MSAFDAVRRVGLTLPGVEESTSYGQPALKVRGTMFVCIASHRSAEPDSLVVRMNIDQRDAMLAEDPDIYYLPDHYAGYASVLVRLPRVSRAALDDLVRTAYRFVHAGTTKRKPPVRRSRASRAN
jgi:hypothetical protein